MNSGSSFLEIVFEQVAAISKGICTIDDEMILSADDPREQGILQGLLYMYEDMELYKKELREKIEAEYKLKILEERNKELLQFNYVASHDLQEPLRTINSFSSLLHRRYHGQLDEEADEYLGFIKKSSERMKQLITGLLNYSRIGNNRELKNIDCQKLLKGIRLDLLASINENSATLNIGNLPVVAGYKLELRQLFQNLISNALKFKHPEINPTVDVFCQKEKDNYTFCVRDNGIGIANEYKDRIFGIFQRLHHRDAYSGTGVGLALCKKIVEMHHGEIWVESTPSEGSSFYFSLPFESGSN